MKTNVNKTNVSIKFSSIEEYREIEKNLIELGYVLLLDDKVNKGYVMVNNSSKTFGKFEYILSISVHQYNSLEEFLKDE